MVNGDVLSQTMRWLICMNAICLAAIEPENIFVASVMAIMVMYLKIMTLIIVAIWASSALALLLNSRSVALAGIANIIAFTLAFGSWHSQVLFSGAFEENDPAFLEVRLIMGVYASAWVGTGIFAIAIARSIFKRQRASHFRQHLYSSADVDIPIDLSSVIFEITTH